MDNELVGNKLKALMAMRKMKRSELAKRLNISYNTLTNKLNGNRDFTINEILTMKEIFDMDIQLCAEIFFSSNETDFIGKDKNRKLKGIDRIF